MEHSEMITKGEGSTTPDLPHCLQVW